MNHPTLAPHKQTLFAFVVLVLMTLPIFYDYFVFQPKVRQMQGSDIFAIWTDGERMARGLNPYSRIHGSDMRQNEKFTTYLPGFFLIEVLVIKMGISSFEEFFPVWRLLNIFIYMGIGILIFFAVKKKSENIALALFSAYFWMLGRWTLPTLRTWQIDFIAIAFLLLAYLALSSRKRLSYLLLGCSLAIKQISVFALPLFVLQELKGKSLNKENVRAIISSLAFIFVVPFLVSLPFLYSDYSGFILSIVFSLTRNPGGLKLESIDQMLELVGLPAKLPLIVSLTFVYWLYWKDKFTLAQGVLLSFLCFITFNSVVFKQYLPWSVAFLGLALADFVTAKDNKQNTNG